MLKRFRELTETEREDLFEFGPVSGIHAAVTGIARLDFDTEQRRKVERLLVASVDAAKSKYFQDRSVDSNMIDIGREPFTRYLDDVDDYIRFSTTPFYFRVHKLHTEKGWQQPIRRFDSPGDFESSDAGQALDDFCSNDIWEAIRGSWARQNCPQCRQPASDWPDYYVSVPLMRIADTLLTDKWPLELVAELVDDPFVMDRLSEEREARSQ